MPYEKRLSMQDLSPDDLGFLTETGYPKYRISQVYTCAQLFKPFEKYNVPSALREELAERYFDRSLKIIKTLTGADGTEKYLYELNDGNIIEGVFMPHSYGNTLCVSTQVGCRMGCAFCASTLNGLQRNLTAGEILGQVLDVNVLKGGDLKNRKITNVVLMGSGEPLDNYDEVVKFLKLVSKEEGIGISLRNVSLSTCGMCERIIQLADSGLNVTLTISLHSPFDDIRAEIMPIARKYSVAEVVNAARYYFNKTGRRVIFEYSLIDGKNTRFADAKRLSELLVNMSAHINLIRLNTVKERGLKGANSDTVKRFSDTLTSLGVSNTLRRSMGNDIEGACGQLRNKFKEGKN